LHVFGKETTSVTGVPMSEFLLDGIDREVRRSITFHGHAPKNALIESLRTARCAVYPSYAEAFAAAPMEAMAQGCPVIYTTRCSGRELIDSGNNGILIDPDQPEQIADAILTLLGNEQLSRRIGEAGRATIQRDFTSDAAIDRLVQYYSACIDSFSGKRSPITVCSSRS
jgi:glycosyltransferase involved in cell wall biosynthesis